AGDAARVSDARRADRRRERLLREEPGARDGRRARVAAEPRRADRLRPARDERLAALRPRAAPPESTNPPRVSPFRRPNRRNRRRFRRFAARIDETVAGFAVSPAESTKPSQVSPLRRANRRNRVLGALPLPRPRRLLRRGAAVGLGAPLRRAARL